MTQFDIKDIFRQGLEGYFRDTGFDQNTVQDSGKPKKSDSN